MLGTQLEKCLKNIFFRLRNFFHLGINIPDIDQSSEVTMPLRKVELTQAEYDYVIQRWPVASPAIVKISKPGTAVVYQTEVKSINKIDDISQECVDYIRALKGKKSSSNKISKVNKKWKSKVNKKQKKTKNTNAKIKENTQKDEAIDQPFEKHDFDSGEQGKIEDSLNVTSLASDDFQENAVISPVDYYYIDPPRFSIEEYPCQSENWNWIGIFDYVVGSSHLKLNPTIPCQDTALATVLDRPILIVSDGAGSCKLSHFGSNVVVRKLSELIAKQEGGIDVDILDADQDYSDDESSNYAKKIIDCSIQALREESISKNDDISNFRCTLSIVVIGRIRSFWLRVGDSPIIVQRTDSTHLLGSINKGEFSNQTNFICEEISEDEFEYGLLEMDDIRGFCALSDGAAERLISTDGEKIAPAVTKILDSLRRGELMYQDLHGFLSDPSFWSHTTGDDKSFAALVFQSNESNK